MAKPEMRRMMPENSLTGQKRQDKNYELVDGVPVLPLKSMVGATSRHDTVTVNALGILFNQLEEYKTHPAIRVILLVDAKAPQLTVWRREGEAWARTEERGLEAVVDLLEIGARLPLTELYDGVVFERT